MILVAGGTGCLGTHAVRRLLARGEHVRILTRDPARVPALHLEVPPGLVETAQGDVRNPTDVARAMVGVRTVVSAMHGFVGKGLDPRSVDFEGNVNLIAAARDAGAEHFVLVSVHGARADHPMDLFRMKHLAEQELARSPLAWTIVRPTAFMETWLTLLGAPLLAKGKTTIFGRGTNPINFVSAHDVARVVELAVTDGALRGQCVEVTGPDNLSFSQLVDTFEAVTGVSGKRGHVPLPLMRVMAQLMRPLNPTLARQIRAGVVMDTEDMTALPATLPVPLTTTLAEAVRRDFVQP